jgi:predicted RND superfamily exporter protein
LVQFGSLAAIGVSMAFLLTFSLLPALLVVLPVRARSQQHAAAWHGVLERLASFGARRTRLILLSAFALGIVGAAGLPKLRVELSLSELWGPDHPVIRAFDFVSAHLQRPDRVELEITLPPGDQIETPGVLGELVQVEHVLAGVDGIRSTRSVATLLLHANRLLQGDEAAGGPEAAAGELMTLISSGDPGGLDAWIAFDQSRLRISAEVEKLSTLEQRALLLEIERLLERALPAQWSFALTGPVVLATQLQLQFSGSQTAIVSASSLIVFVLIAVYLRSLPWALLAMIPNTVALLLLFGVMGHLGVRIDFGSAICAPIAIGIAADDTIHFLTAYARERRAGLDPIAALRTAIAGVGEAVITTSTALALGFLSLASSPFASIASLGVLSAIAILGATLADLLVLPALIAAVGTSRARVPALHAAPTFGDNSPPASL